MYYADGFLNKETCFSKGHIWHFGMVWQDKRCLLCCVVEDRIKKDASEMEAVLRKWFEQELPYALEKSEIQKEWKRFGTWLKKWYGTGMGVKSPVLYLALGKEIYSTESDEAVLSRFKGHRGVILKPASLIEDFDESPEQSIEERANRWKADMLRAMSIGHLEQGYFIVWEDAYDF